MALNNDIQKERLELVKQIKKIQEEQGIEVAKLDKQYIKMLGRLHEIVSIQQEQVSQATELSNSIQHSVNEASSLSNVYRNIKDSLDDQRKIQASISGNIVQQMMNQGGLNDKQQIQLDTTQSILNKYTNQADIATELSQLSEEDGIQRANLLNTQYEIGKTIEKELELLDKRFLISKEFAGIQSELEESIKNQTDEAIKLSSLSVQQKQTLEEQDKIYAAIEGKLNAIGSTISTFLSRPQVAAGAFLVTLGQWEHKVTDINKEFGFTILDMNSAAKSAGLLGFIFDDTVGTVKALTNEFGSLEDATLKTQFRVGSMASLLGISNTEAVQLVGHFSRMEGGSKDIAMDMIQTTKEYAKQNNVIPSQVLSDLAGNAETFAIFAKEGGENMIKAATGARMLGTDLGTVAGIADNLLDFETSMTKELELGAMLGRSINLNKARQLAYDGKIVEATQETLRQVGGIEAFNKMDYFQKKQTADLLGVSVDELKRMADNQKKVGTMGAVISKEFSDVNNSLNMITNKFLGTGIKALGGYVGTVGELDRGFKAMGLNVSAMVGNLAKGAKSLMSKGWQLLSGKGGMGGAIASTGTSTAKSVAGKATEALKGDKGLGDKIAGKGSITSSVSKINTTALIKGAAALVIVAGALWVLGKGLQEFKDVGIDDVGVMAAGIITLSAALAGLSFLSGPILIGAAALLVAAGAVWVLGKGLQEIAIGFSALESISGVLTGLIGMTGNIMLLAGAFGTLAGSLTAVGIAGIIALPALMGISIASSGLGAIANILGGGSSETGAIQDGSLSEYETQMLTKMDTLIKAVQTNRDVYLDKEKVTSSVMKTSEKSTGNVFGLSVA